MNFALAALVLLAGRVAQEGPADWLRADGKGEAWVKATKASRDLLQKLDVRDPRIEKHLPRLRERCAILRKVDGFDWKTITAVQILEGTLEDLAQGVTPLKRHSGQGLGFGYWSETMQRIEAIWVQVPPAYDPSRNYQIFMYYKCGGGIHLKDGRANGGYRPTVEMCRKFDDTFHAWSSLSTQVKGRYGAEHELEEAMAALQKEFSIDPDRVFLSGWSDGGFTSFWLASRFPHLVAGIAPNCANWQYQNLEEVGLFNVPVLVLDGWGDGGYNSINFTRFHALSNMGYDIQCLFGQHGHSYQPYEDEEEFGKVLAWARTRKRNLFPKRIRYATWNLAWNRAYWFSIDRVAEPALAAQVDAEVKDGNRIEVRARNVAAYRLSLDGKLVDPARPVEVVTNGKTSYQGPFTPELAIEVVPKPPGRFAKTAEMPDEIIAVIDRSSYDMRGPPSIPAHRWLAVRATGGTDAERAAVRAWVPEDARDDAEVTERDLETCHLILYGGPALNRVTAKIASDLPVKFEKGRFAIGDRVYAGPAHGVKFLHPNPLNPKRYVIVMAFNDLAAAQGRGFHGIARGGWEFRAGDGIVYGLEDRGPRFAVGFGGAAHDYYVWDAAWRAPDPAPLGTAERRFDYAALLRLKVDAMREATGVDAAVIYAHPASWNRLKTFIPQGPVTLNDLAATQMFPEVAMLCEVSGKTLKALATDGAASTVLPDLEPEKSYRIAIDYVGAWRHCYGVNPSKMPRLFPFRSAQEYLEGPSTSLALSNLRHSEIDWVEAAAQYLRKRGTISPRPLAADLRRYVMDPEVNDFSACDWVHLRIDKGGPIVHLGLKVRGDPEIAPPRPDSKAFVEIDSEGKRITENWSRLGKRLPVRLEASATRRSVDSPEAGGAVVRLTEIRLRLINEGAVDVEGIAVLGDGDFHAISGSTWSDSFAGGLIDASGDPKRPTRLAAKLFVFSKEPAALRPVVIPNVGYNVGLVGHERRIALKANETVSLPVVSLVLEKPNGADFGKVLGGLKAGVMESLGRE